MFILFDHDGLVTFVRRDVSSDRICGDELEEVINDPNQEHFIDMLLGRNTLGNSTDAEDPNAKTPENGYSLDVSKTIDELKKDVLFRPPEVDPCVKDITNDPSYYACGNLLGQW